MLRKIAAGTSAAVVAAGLAAAPALAAELPASPGTALPGGAPRTPRCGDAAQTEQTSFEPRTTDRFVFGPLADVPHLQSAGPSCVTVTPVVTEFSGARRRTSPPLVGTPAPEAPSSPPPEDSTPEAPPPVGSGPPPSAGPPADAAVPPPDTSNPLAPAPERVAPSPPPVPRAPLGESVLPETQPPARAPSRLPQTASDTRPLTAAGGGSLIAAGLAWIGGARRRRKGSADPVVGD